MVLFCVFFRRRKRTDTEDGRKERKENRCRNGEAAGVLRDTAAIRTPFYVVDETLLKKNLEILKDTAERAGCRILLAQKAFSMYSVYPLIRQYLSGTAASGLYEARLGKTEFGGETHVFSAAYRPDEFDEILNYADHIVFNTPGQVLKYGEKVKKPENRRDSG